MKRERIIAQYHPDVEGIIPACGKFEGEMLYAPHFYDITLDGGGEELSYMEDGRGEYAALVGVTPDDKLEFPELGADTTYVLVCEGEQGFVSCRELTDEQADKVRVSYELDNELVNEEVEND